MKKPAYISILLAAVVVFCPFQCILGGCFTSETTVGVSASTDCCDHCRQTSDENGDRSPKVPADCQCGDCFCRGALPVNDVSRDIAFAEHVTYLMFWIPLESPSQVTTTDQIQNCSFLIPVDASAVEVRAALCCWLI